MSHEPEQECLDGCDTHNCLNCISYEPTESDLYGICFNPDSPDGNDYVYPDGFCLQFK